MTTLADSDTMQQKQPSDFKIIITKNSNGLNINNLHT